MEARGVNAAITDDRSLAIIVFAGITMLLSVLFISLRTLIAVKKKIQVRWDDLFIFAAVATSLAQSITWIFASRHGLGRHLASVSKADLVSYFEFTYSSQVLGIFAMTFSKTSVSLLMRRLSIDRAPILWSGPLASIATWACFSIPAILFQCEPSNPWNSSPSNCPHRDGIWFSVGSFNIVTDMFLALYVASKIWNLKMDSRGRTTIITLFVSRLVVPIVTMLQVPLASRSFRTDDFTYSSVDFAVTTNVVVHLSLITAIVPRIRLLATPTAFLSAAQPNPHATHPLSPLRPLSPQISSLPRLNLDLIMTNTSDHSRDPHNRQYPTSAQPTPDVMSTRTSSLSYESHNRPYSQQPLIKALSREATHSTGKESTSINADTTPLELVPASTLARLNTNVYRPYAIAESVHSNWSKDTSEIEYAWGGYTNVPIATETPKVLEIGMKTEVQIEVDEVGGQRSNSLGEQRQEKVKPRDILKLEQKRNCRRIDESSVYIRGGFGTYS